MMGKIFNVKLKSNFLEVTAKYLAENINKKDIPYYTIVLPNNRSCREFKRILLSLQPFCLARIKSISDDVIFDEQKITMLIIGLFRSQNTNIPLNTQFELASSVSKLIKELIINNVDFSSIKTLVPEHLMEFWQHTITIVEVCLKDPIINKTIQKSVENLRFFLNSIKNNKDKVIAIGIGNTNQYTKEFMRSVYESKNGIIFTIGEENTRNYEYNKEILGKDVCMSTLDISEDKNESANNFIPAYAEFQDLADEAQAIAISVREAVYEHKKVLIVASNTDLSSRIRSELLRWNIVADDSYGDDFLKTANGISILLIFDAINNRFSVSSVLKILKANKKYSQTALILEVCLKQKKDFFSNFFEAISKIENVSRETSDDIGRYKNNIRNQDFSKIIDFSKKFQEILFQYELFTDKVRKKSFIYWSSLITDLIKLVDIEYAEVFKELTGNYQKYSDCFTDITFDEYSIFMKKHVLKTSVRHAQGYTEGVCMLGAIEAQLLDSDKIIIAGANEDSFAPVNNQNFWFSESMMKAMGIPTSENKSQFIQCIFERLVNKKSVLITRSEKILGVQQRRYVLLDDIKDIKINYHLDSILKRLKKAVKFSPIKDLPAPNPDIMYRPIKFSVSDIELLKSNPYAFYAKKILKLRELEELDEIKNLHGNFIHAVLELFVRNKRQNSIYKTADIVMKNMRITQEQLGLYFFQMKSIFTFIEQASVPDDSFTEIWGNTLLKVTPELSCKIICKADRIDLNSNNTISIIDYKTSSSKITKKDVISGKNTQLVIESWVAKNKGFNIPATETFSLQYWFLKRDSEITFVTNSCDDTNKLIDQIMEKVANLIYQYNINKVSYGVNIGDQYNQDYMHLARLNEWFHVR